MHVTGHYEENPVLVPYDGLSCTNSQDEWFMFNAKLSHVRVRAEHMSAAID
jgi:hypothetical protein